MEKLIVGPYIESKNLGNSVNEFLSPFENISNINLYDDIRLDFERESRTCYSRISPILTLARPNDAKEIVKVYHNIYNGTYPYTEMTVIDEVRRMIKDSHFYFILFKDQMGNIAGCVTFVLDFLNKRGYIRGFMLKNEYQGKIDIVKAMMGSMIGMCATLRSKILVWYVENRTAHAKSQYPMWICGIRPVAFFPNKDIFYNKIESDLMQVIYDKNALKEHRSEKVPRILPDVVDCYEFSERKFFNRYPRGEFELIGLDILNLNRVEITDLKSDIKIKRSKDKFGYEKFKFYLPETSSYFKFLYTPQVKNFEKTEYKVNSLEELYCFTRKYKEIGEELGIRYYEIFVSAYKPDHQKVFYDFGFRPRGYIPSWKYNIKRQKLEDYIVFNSYKGRIDQNIQLIDEGKELLQCLGFRI